MLYELVYHATHSSFHLNKNLNNEYLSQDAACDGVIYSINNKNSAQEPEGNLLPIIQGKSKVYSWIKINKSIYIYKYK